MLNLDRFKKAFMGGQDWLLTFIGRAYIISGSVQESIRRCSEISISIYGSKRVLNLDRLKRALMGVHNSIAPRIPPA